MKRSWGFNRPKGNKHGNRKVVAADGEKFDSIREMHRWEELKVAERAGAISRLSRQVAYVLAPSVRFEGQRAKPAIRYRADAVYVRDGKTVVEDAKSPHLRKDPVYRIKKHLMKSVHNIEIEEV